jgi:hypothetical protein
MQRSITRSTPGFSQKCVSRLDTSSRVSKCARACVQVNRCTGRLQQQNHPRNTVATNGTVWVVCVFGHPFSCVHAHTRTRVTLCLRLYRYALNSTSVLACARAKDYSIRVEIRASPRRHISLSKCAQQRGQMWDGFCADFVLDCYHVCASRSKMGLSSFWRAHNDQYHIT